MILRNSGSAARAPAPALAGMAVAALSLAVVNLMIWYPGEPNNDSNSQFAQIQAGVLNDWHPPAMTRLWEVLLNFGTGTAPLFVLNIVFYWLSSVLIAITLRRAGHRYAGWWVLAIFAIPTLIMQNINITKDVHFAVALLVAFSLAFAWHARGGKAPVVVKTIAIALIAYAMLVRINAVFLVAPTVAYVLRPQWLQRPMILSALTVLIGIALVPLVSAVNHRVLMAHDAGAIRSLQLFDLGGIADRTGDMSVFGRQSSLGYAEIQRCYSPTMWDTMRQEGHCPDLVSRIGRQRENEFERLPPLGDLWLKAIARHPGPYFAHRFANFNSATYFLEPPHHLDAVRQFNTAAARQPSLKNHILDIVRYFPLLMPGVILALGLALIFSLLGSRALLQETAPLGVVALLIGALAYGFSFLVIGVATDLRYFFYCDLAVLVATVLVVTAWVSGRRRRQGERIATWAMILGAGVLAVSVLVTLGGRLMLQSPAPDQNLSAIWSAKNHV